MKSISVLLFLLSTLGLIRSHPRNSTEGENNIEM